MAAAPIRRSYLLYFYAVLFAGIALVTGGVAWVVGAWPGVPDLLIVGVAGAAAVGVSLAAASVARAWERRVAAGGPFVVWDETGIRGPGGWRIDVAKGYESWTGYDEVEVRTVRFRTERVTVFCRLSQGETMVTLVAREGSDGARASGLPRSVLAEGRGPEIVLWSEDLLEIIRRFR